jgi:hypothetical protein
MGHQRCSGCTKFAKQKKLVNEHQKAKGIEKHTLCTPCAKKLYPDFVGLVCEHANCTTAPQGGAFGPFCVRHTPTECEHADCTTAPQGGAHGKFCVRHTPLECEHADCTTAPRGGAFGPFCARHTPLECEHADCTTAPEGGAHGKFCFRHSTYIKPIILMEEPAESVKKLKDAAIRNLDKGKPVYVGLMGTSGLNEINQDTCRMIKADSTLEKDSHLAIYVDGNDGQSAHDVARDAERVLIDSIGVERLLNERRGGAGRHPFDKSVGGIFIIVFKEPKKRKAFADISNK